MKEKGNGGRSIIELLETMERGDWNFSDAELDILISFMQKLKSDIELLIVSSGERWRFTLDAICDMLYGLEICNDARKERSYEGN